MMELTHRMQDSTVILSIRGEITGQGIHQLDEYFAAFRQDDTMGQLVINFEQVSFISSAGIAWIVLIARELQTKHIPTLLCHLGDKLQQLAKITKLDRIVKIFATEAEALAAIQ